MEHFYIIFICALGTYLTRVLAYVLINKSNSFLDFLQKNMPLMIMVFLVAYFFKDKMSANAIPLNEIYGFLFVCFLHFVFKKWFLSIFGGLVLYLFLVN